MAHLVVSPVYATTNPNAAPAFVATHLADSPLAAATNPGAMLALTQHM